MEAGANKSNSSDGRKLTSKNLQIRLLGHCIICLRKTSDKRKESRCGTSESIRNDDDDNDAAPEMAPKSVITSPGFLTTFNQVWAVLQTKWKDKNSTRKERSSDEDAISLENILENRCGSTNISFSRAPTICERCCDKVLAVENLMKAVRQQVREIGMLLEEGRRRQDGGLGDFEMSLRDNGLEESVIKATLEFVGVLGRSRFSQGTCQEVDLKDGEGSAAEAVTGPNLIQMQTEFDEENSLVNSQMDGDDNNEGKTWESYDEDPDYIKSEPEEDDEVDESEEKMEVDEDEEKNDPDWKGQRDPLASFHDKIRSKPEEIGKSNGPGEKKGHHGKVTCTYGRVFASTKYLRDHMRRNRNIHPEYKAFEGTLLGNRQMCELCGKWVMHTDILHHLTEVHLNGQAKWVIRCPNDKCPYMFVSSTKFQLHFHRKNSKECLKIWKEKCAHVCDICGFKGVNLLKIKHHLRDKHENGKEKKFKCPISGCGKMFCVKQSVHFHLQEHQSSPKITKQTCDKCGENLQVNEMEEHLKDKHGVEEVIGCKQCALKFSGREELVEHLFEHRRVGISCDICGDEQEKFVSRYSVFREHYFVVHQLCPKKYKCGECDSWYWRKKTKEEHELRIHRETSKKWEYTRTKAVIKIKERNYECDICNVKFALEVDLLSHNIKVHGADPFKCDICGETFKEKGKFNKHKKEHAGIVWQKEWKCEVDGCGRIFKKRQLWKHHEEIGHGGEKKHVCEECGKGYSFAATLRQHRDAVHLGLRPWVCEQCGDRFTSGQILKKHKMIHTGERPFGCDICGQRFRHREVLRRHVEGHEKKGSGFKPNGPMKQIRKRKAE